MICTWQEFRGTSPIRRPPTGMAPSVHPSFESSVRATMQKFSRALSFGAFIFGGGATLAANMPPPGPVPPPANQKLAHDIFRDIVEVRSVHAEGTKGVADILVRYLKTNGFTDSEISVVPETDYPRQVNVVVRLK